MKVYRLEYPRPNFVRKQWLNLNGIWDFEFDDDKVGKKEKWFLGTKKFSKKINVPFVYQSKLSGINDPSIHDWIWYKRELNIPEEWQDKRILLHFGAVDYRAWVYINGHQVGFHEGGHVPFSLDITEFLNYKNDFLVVHVEDPSTDETIPRGKQYWEEKPEGIWYTRSSGIWQTVWLEPVSDSRIESLRLTPDIDHGEITVEIEILNHEVVNQAVVEIEFKGEKVVKDTLVVNDPYIKRKIDLFNRHINRTSYHHSGWTWSPETPNLFDIRITLLNKENEVIDEVESYFGMRKIHTENGMVYLNNKPYYQKLVLDQGYWPDGLMTAPSDEDFKKDILLAKEMGFNGCRKHQKVEDPRFLYWADQLGFLVWGECAASQFYSENSAARLTREWIEIINRDYNHPSIVAWVPINESWGVPFIRTNKQQQSHSLAMYYLLKSLDVTRLVISNDGWELTITDICAIHNYNHGEPHETEKFDEFRQSLYDKESILNSRPSGRPIYANGFQHMGEPILLTEFGGIAFKVGDQEGWGYSSVKDEEEFISEYSRVVKAVYSSQIIHGFCYTQLTDVEQEINGLLTYDRKPKCDLQKIKEINNRWHLQVIKK